jgi:electron-transferring-flavoprotein dehydrogenase
MGLWTKLKTAVKTFGHWGMLYDLREVNRRATDLKQVYDDYPASPDGFDAWRQRRDDLLEEVYDIAGADPKY